MRVLNTSHSEMKEAERLSKQGLSKTYYLFQLLCSTPSQNNVTFNTIHLYVRPNFCKNIYTFQRDTQCIYIAK